MNNEKQVEPIAAVCRVWCDSGDYILFFPDYSANPGYVESWMWVGQHGEADPGICRRPYTRSATADEAARAIADYERCYNGINGEFFQLRQLKHLRRPLSGGRHGR